MKERISGFDFGQEDFGQEGIIDVKFVRETGTKLVQAKCISKNFTCMFTDCVQENCPRS